MTRVVTGPGLTRPKSSRTAVTGDYRNPFRSAAVSPERIDQGVDYAGRAGDPIYALGPARVVEVISYGGNSGWPDGSGVGTSGGWVSYELTSGPLMGKIVYVAEGVQPAVRAGQQVDSSTVVGHFAGAGGIETGWAGPPSQGDQTLAYADKQSDFGSSDIGGWSTEAGVTFSNLMAKLGAPPGILQGGGVHGAGGQVVDVAATQVNPGGSSGTGTSTAGGSGGPGCLISAPSGKLFSFVGFNFGPTVGGGCIFAKSQARAVLGAGLVLIGGGVFMVATLVLAAYGLKASGAGAAAGKVAGGVTEAAGAVTGQPEVMMAGRQIRSQGATRTVSRGVERQHRQRRQARSPQRQRATP